MGRKVLVCVAVAAVLGTGRPDSTEAQATTWQDVQVTDIEGMVRAPLCSGNSAKRCSITP